VFGARSPDKESLKGSGVKVHYNYQYSDTPRNLRSKDKNFKTESFTQYYKDLRFKTKQNYTLCQLLSSALLKEVAIFVHNEVACGKLLLTFAIRQNFVFLLKSGAYDCLS